MLPTPSTSNAHLSFPPSDTNTTPATKSSLHQPLLLEDRLFVGNLHPTVDEYALLKIFSKFGKVTKLDFLFHKTGPCKGKPRGYAFVEYSNRDDTVKALGAAHDKLLRGRKLVVTYAHQAPFDQAGTSPHRTKSRKGMTEANRLTTLSMLKTGLASKTEETKDKIAIMEAKLRQMEQSKIVSASSVHPFLPAKPASGFSSMVGRAKSHRSQTPSFALEYPQGMQGRESDRGSKTSAVPDGEEF